MNDPQNISGDVHLVGIVGSLRSASYNSALLRAARELAPDGLEVRIHDLADIPLYNGDVEEAGVPGAVEALAEAVAAADGVLIATPEYNAGVPGVLKNAIDWLSRSSVGKPLAGKPVGIVGATPGRFGTGRAQESLKLTLLAVRAIPFVNGGIAIAGASDKFDGAELTDETTRGLLSKYMERFHAWLTNQ